MIKNIITIAIVFILLATNHFVVASLLTLFVLVIRYVTKDIDTTLNNRQYKPNIKADAFNIYDNHHTYYVPEKRKEDKISLAQLTNVAPLNLD